MCACACVCDFAKPLPASMTLQHPRMTPSGSHQREFTAGHKRFRSEHSSPEKQELLLLLFFFLLRACRVLCALGTFHFVHSVRRVRSVCSVRAHSAGPRTLSVGTSQTQREVSTKNRACVCCQHGARGGRGWGGGPRGGKNALLLRSQCQRNTHKGETKEWAAFSTRQRLFVWPV